MLLSADLAEFEDAVNQAIKVKLSQTQFDALVIFAYNIGKGAFLTSSAVKLINDPNDPTVSPEFPTLESAWKAFRWDDGVEVPGMINRRQAEWTLFTTGVYQPW
jgi:lysozyme